MHGTKSFEEQRKRKAEDWKTQEEEIKKEKKKNYKHSYADWHVSTIAYGKKKNREIEDEER